MFLHVPKDKPLTKRSDAPPWHTLTSEQVCRELATDCRSGLSETEAQARLARLGPNRLTETRPTPAWRLFLAQFEDLLIIILIIAALVSGIILKELLDAAAIGAILLLNALLGFIQEYRAEQALSALKKLVAPQARVIRGGVPAVIPAEGLAPGDLVELAAGDKAPADIRVSEAHVLAADESSLTGESAPVDKRVGALPATASALGDRVNMLYSGTTVTRGRGLGIVVATGDATEMGAVVELVAVKNEKTPLQAELKRLGTRIAFLCIGVSVVVLVSGGLHNHHWQLMLLTAISLAVAAIPEGLPAAVTVSLALGVKRMVAKNALVRRLHAVETLGSTTFICTDKTGTLTVNRMAVERLVWQERILTVSEARAEMTNDECRVSNKEDKSSLSLRELVQGFVLCNDARKDPEGRVTGDPLEVGLYAAARELGVNPEALAAELPRQAEIPFDAERKAMSTIHREGDRYHVLVKGAPESVFAMCRPAPTARWTELNQQLTHAGFRTIAFAGKHIAQLPSAPTAENVETDLALFGLVALSDPPRTEVREAIATCRKAGIKVAMVTGDHRLTAEHVAREVGLGETDSGPVKDTRSLGHLATWPLSLIITGPELDALSDAELAARVNDISIYARVSPLQKVKIVRALKDQGHIVAMTGDGVNDAPALRLADIGVAMGIAGTDVAKEASDMVLLDDNFATIVAAVREGRMIFANLRKFVYFLLSCNLKEVLSVLFASLVGYPIVLPIQLLWVNLITDGAPALALGVDPADEGMMSRPPRDARESILSAPNLLRLVVQGAILTLGSITAYVVLSSVLHRSDAEVRTAAFAILCLSQLFHAFNFRVGNRFFFSRGWLANRYLVGAVALSIALQAAITYQPALNRLFGTVPLPAVTLEIVLACSLIPVLVINLVNLLGARRKPSRE
jgi:Ca2+-transporting ATPase